MSFPVELKTRLRNVHTYVVTPYEHENLYEVDFSALQSNLRFLINNGVRVVALGGGTGEFEALTPAEHVKITQTALQTVADQALVVTTVPGNLGIAVELIREYERLGVEIVLGMPPLVRGKVPTDLAGVADYFRLLCSRTSLPVMPYNTQSWPVEVFCQLAEIDGIIGIKDPCLNPHELFKAIQRLGDRFVWVGNKRHDPGVLHLRFQMGIEAFTSGQTNFWPGPELDLFRLAERQDWRGMIELQGVCAPLERLRLQNDDAAMVKAAMDYVGLHGGAVRPPRRDLTKNSRDRLSETLAQLDVPRVDGVC